jgi:hypothetical protein
MCLVFDARPSTKDIDAVFKPAKEIREAAKEIAHQFGLREDWLNDGVKSFLKNHNQNIFLDLPFLKIFIPEYDYLLAMKTLAARVDTTDKDDVLLLIKKLNVKSKEEVFSILEKYYPQEQIRPATQFFIEELFQHL